MAKSIDLNAIYSLRRNFTIIGLTGRTGSGCTEAANLLSKGFDENIYPEPSKGKYKQELSLYRKYRIIYNYANQNFKPYTIITYKHILTWFILRNSHKELIKYLENKKVLRIIRRYFDHSINYHEEIQQLNKLKNRYNEIRKSVRQADKEISQNKFTDLYNVFFSQEFIAFSNDFHAIFGLRSSIKHNKIFQLISDSLRRESIPYSTENGGKKNSIKADNIYCIAIFINQLIKSVRSNNEYETKDSTRIVIDSLRNPLEILYLKERYSAFYMVSVQRESEKRKKELKKRFNRPREYEIIETIESEEHKGGAAHEFYKQDVSECIQKSDIHLEYITEDECKALNEIAFSSGVAHTPRVSFEKQILRYIALIGQPGIVTPNAEERCMQIAYTAKYNSGCISRQVGALITDENYSIKAIGWNDAADGQVSCSLRNIGDYFNKDVDNDYLSYTTYERNNEIFNEAVKKHYYQNIKNNKNNLSGRNVCFCFKSLQNHITEGKNQIHTRALHAEENAFLQIVKYGGQGIINGKLFSTASPCELCSKKAYQLNIKTIYFIDPYPGIAVDQIMKAGEKPLELQQFVGAIGKAYHRFYEPFMAYKDEISLLLGIEIEDYATKMKNKKNDCYQILR